MEAQYIKYMVIMGIFAIIISTCVFFFYPSLYEQGISKPDLPDTPNIELSEANNIVDVIFKSVKGLIDWIIWTGNAIIQSVAFLLSLFGVLLIMPIEIPIMLKVLIMAPIWITVAGGLFMIASRGIEVVRG